MISNTCARVPVPVVLALVILTVSAAARDPTREGSAIVTPHEGAPALVLAGGTFSVVTTRPGELSIGSENYGAPLKVAWSQLASAQFLAQCDVAADTPAGSYRLDFSDGASHDQLRRSVFVYESFPAEYTVAHVANPRIGAILGESSPYETFKQVLAAIDNSGAALVLVNGDLTNDGEIQQFRDFLDALNTCALPTFVSPGPRDTALGNYAPIFGPADYAVTFGRDAFLAFDTTGFTGTDPLGPQDARLHVLRRQTRASRWSVGLTHRVPPYANLRTHLTLFVDDPLDFLLIAETPDAAESGALPWSRTGYLTVPSATEGAYRLITVDAQQPLPGQVRYAATP